MEWATQVRTPRDLRMAAFAVFALLYFARNDTTDGVQVGHLSWSSHGLRLFESRFKGHAEVAGARVLFTPEAKCAVALAVLRRYTDFLAKWGKTGVWHLWQLPWERKPPGKEAHLTWIREAVRMAGCDVPFDMKIDVHMCRATATCHSLAQNVPRPVVQFRAGWTSISSMDAYARPVICGKTSKMLWSHLMDILNTEAA